MIHTMVPRFFHIRDIKPENYLLFREEKRCVLHVFVCLCVCVCCARMCAPRKEPRTQIVIPGYHNLNVTIKLSRSASYQLIHFITCPTWGKIKEERILLATNM